MATVDQSTVYLCMMAIVGLTFLLISIFCKSDAKKKGQQGAQMPANVQRRNEEAPPGVRRRGRRNRMANREDSEDEEADLDADPDDPMGFDPSEYEGKIGTKKLRKLQEKAERREQRLLEEQERKEKKEREALLEKQRKKEEEIRKKEEEEREEQAKILREEEEKREHEEYLKLKEAFTVEEEGEVDVGPDLDSQSLLQEFIDYIKEMKVIMLEDLASHFKLRTQDAIDRVKELQEEGRLTGVMDDRGKFIYITMEELESVAKFIKQHGRVSISDLAKSSNRLINLNPDNAATQKRLLSNVSG